MKDRIKQIMESKHMTQQVFAEFIGTTPATLSGIFNDRTRPTINIVEAIKKKIPDINTDWLMFGFGEMYHSAPSPLPADGDSAVRTPEASGVKNGVEPIFDFSDHDAYPSQSATLQGVSNNSVRNTRLVGGNEEVKIVNKPPRHVTEIRVYYDDQTWESFVPAKK